MLQRVLRGGVQQVLPLKGESPRLLRHGQTKKIGHLRLKNPEIHSATAVIRNGSVGSRRARSSVASAASQSTRSRWIGVEGQRSGVRRSSVSGSSGSAGGT